MVIRFIVGLMAIIHVNCQNYQQVTNGFSPQNGNYLHNNFPQGAGGTYHQTNALQQQNVNQQTYQQPPYNSVPQQRGASQNPQFGSRYQSSNQPASSHAVAHGVVQHQQQPRAQPLPRAYTSAPINPPNTELTPLATASANFPPQTSSPPQTFNNFQQPQGQFFYPPNPANSFNGQQPQTQGQQSQFQGQQSQFQGQQSQFQGQQSQFQGQNQGQFQQPQNQGQFQQPNSFNGNNVNNGNFYNNPYSNNTNAYREQVVNYTFKEGTPPYYCAYGLPVPEYNTPRKKCVPWHPFCGIVFTCIMDV